MREENAACESILSGPELSVEAEQADAVVENPALPGVDSLTNQTQVPSDSGQTGSLQVQGKVGGVAMPALKCYKDKESSWHKRAMLRQLSYVIKNQLGHPKPPTRGFGTQNTPIGG